MIPVLYIVIIIVAVFLITAVSWRFASKRHAIPCPVWMKWMLDPFSSGGISGRTRKTMQILDISPGMRILDAGCGPGRLSIPLAEMTGQDGEVTALDIQEGMLDVVRMRAQKKNLTNIRFVRAGLGEGKAEKNYYDRAVLITVLGEIPGREAALKEIFESLKPGGILLVEETICDPHFQTHSTVTGLAETFGFVEKEFMGNRFSYILTLKKPENA